MDQQQKLFLPALDFLRHGDSDGAENLNQQRRQQGQGHPHQGFAAKSGRFFPFDIQSYITSLSINQREMLRFQLIFNP